jgi:hypothetical protein
LFGRVTISFTIQLRGDVLAELALGGERAAVNDAERFFVLLIRQGIIPTE